MSASARAIRGVIWFAVASAAALACSRTTELLPVPAGACVKTGPAIRLGADCTGALAARYGRYALCSCNDLTLTGNLFVGGPGGPVETRGDDPPGYSMMPAIKTFTAAVGTDGDLRVAQYTEIAGTLVTAGVGDATFVHGGHVQGNLRGGGGFTTMTTRGIWVSGEMNSGGDVSGMFKIVGGALRVPAGAIVAADVESVGIVREAVAVPAPCGCGAAPAVDLVAAVAARHTGNANATLSFPAEFLAGVDHPETLDLPCGEFYVPEIRTTADGPLELRVHGRAALFVGGEVRLLANLDVTLDPGAELDLVVAGSFSLHGRVFGSPASPARTRLWVGGPVVSLPNQAQVGAVVYAPAAVFSAGAGLTFSGSLYVATLSVDGDVRISYDPEIMEGGTACGISAPLPVE